MTDSESMKLYKVLGPDGCSIHGGSMQWSLPTVDEHGEWQPGDWRSVAGTLRLCERGLHLTDERGVWQNWIKQNAVAWEAEVAQGAPGDCVGTLSDDDDRKIAVRECRLLRPMPEPDWWVATKRFIRDDIPAVPWFQPDGNPDPSWRLFTADSWDSAWDSARASARASAWDSAWASARDSARDSAWNSAWASARASAWDSAWDSGDAAALFVATHYVCGDLVVPQEHRDHAAARWNVWQKGYALLCDVNGVLFVYAGPAVMTAEKARVS